MIHYQYKNAKILFIGINPHHGSYRRGVPFSNNKMFWYLLNMAGLLNEKIEDLRSDAGLKRIYDEKFNQVYNLGLVNVVDRPSRDVSELRKNEELTGRRRIHRIIKREKPKVVCFVGRVTFEKFIGHKKFDFGWQQDIHQSKIYVMHFPIRGEAAIRVKELQKISTAATRKK